MHILDLYANILFFFFTSNYPRKYLRFEVMFTYNKNSLVSNLNKQCALKLPFIILLKSQIFLFFYLLSFLVSVFTP